MALMDKIKGVFMGSLKGKLAAAMVYNDLKKMKKELDYNEYGGAPIMDAQARVQDPRQRQGLHGEERPGP